MAHPRFAPLALAHALPCLSWPQMRDKVQADGKRRPIRASDQSTQSPGGFAKRKVRRPATHPRHGLGADCWNANTSATLAKGRAPVESAPCFVTGVERCAPDLALLCQPFSTQVYRSRYSHNAALIVIGNRRRSGSGTPRASRLGSNGARPAWRPPLGGGVAFRPFT